MKLKRLNQKGFSHWLAPIVVVALIVGVGGYIQVRQSHADSITSVKFGANAWHLIDYASIVQSSATGGPVVKMNKGVMVNNEQNYQSVIAIQNDNLSSFTRLNDFVTSHFGASAKLCLNARSVSGNKSTASLVIAGMIAGHASNHSPFVFNPVLNGTKYATVCTNVTIVAKQYYNSGYLPGILVWNNDYDGPVYINWLSFTAQ